MTINEMEEKFKQIRNLQFELDCDARKFLKKAEEYDSKLYEVGRGCFKDIFRNVLQKAEHEVKEKGIYSATFDRFRWLEDYMNLHPLE